MTFGSGRDLHASFSGDGQRLLFAIVSWNSDLWAMPMDATAGKPAGAPFALIVSSREDTRGAWSADGRKIAFTSDRNGDMNLFVCEFDAAKRAVSPPVQITTGPGGHYQATWNPNGRQLAYFSRQSGHENIWLVELDEASRPIGVPRALTHGGGADNNPAWSPDGKHIAFMSSRAGVNQLYVMNADGSGERRVMSPPVSGHYLRWLDANTIVANSKGQLLAATLDGREPERRGAIGGAHITFSPTKDLVADTDHTFLLMSRPGLEATVRERIFRFPEPDVGMDYTVWSPDGRFMLFDRSNPQGGDIYEIRNPE
jgi:Tol biopolymer transport system component